MNIHHLKYILAVDTHRHFGKAAEDCCVTQPTLSMMIQKLESELDVKIFDRTKQPVVPTQAGEAILKQAKVILEEAMRMKVLVEEMKGQIQGEIRIGIIPTVAPYLLPLFLSSFLKKYPMLKIKIAELTTQQIIDKLKHHQLDAGILATPLNNESLNEMPLYYEEFVVYASPDEKLMKKKFLLQDDIDTNHLWLLEEGHCLRSQVLNLCKLRKKDLEKSNLEYEAGSIQTLKKMVDMNNGITILPELALKELTAKDMKNVRHFKPQVPVREISLVTYRHFVKKRIVDALKQAICDAVPDEMLSFKRKFLTPLDY